jgi:flagellar protein FliO/FliZ
MILMLAWIRRAAGLSMGMLFSVQTFAADAAPQAAASPVAGTMQMLFGLGVVLAAIAATAWLLRRMAPGQTGVGNLRVVAAVAVGPKERVVLVDVGDTRLVLGVATGQVNLLHQMSRPSDADQDAALPVMPPFVEKLKELMAARQERK